jgi:hypothetical protein
MGVVGGHIDLLDKQQRTPSTPPAEQLSHIAGTLIYKYEAMIMDSFPHEAR